MWTLASIRIFVQDLPDSSNQIISRLQPINAGTTLQIFGWENTIYKLSGLVVGLSDCASLRDLRKSATTHSLVGPAETFGTVGDFYVKNVTITPTKGVFQTLRSDLPCETPVFNVEVELYL